MKDAPTSKEFEETARRYREELFRLYQQNKPEPPKPEPPKPEPSAPSPSIPNPKPPVPEPPMPNPPKPDAPMPNPPEAEPIPPKPALRLPPPPKPLPPLPFGIVLEKVQPPQPFVPALAAEPIEPPPSPEPEASNFHAPMPKTGLLKVVVQTAGGALPVPNASVTVTARTPEGEQLAAHRITDVSGRIEPVSLAAPAGDPYGKQVPYALYDVTVEAEGFRTEFSRDLPIFGGITSVLSFLLVPKSPGEAPEDSEEYTYYNQEPVF